MPVFVEYPCHPATGAPRVLNAAEIRAIAGRVRHQIERQPDTYALTVPALLRACQRVAVNGRGVSVAWDLASPLFDETGGPVLGMCDTDPSEPEHAYVSVNPHMTLNRPDLELSTAAHELGHVVFDVPAALETGMRRYRAVATNAAMLNRVTSGPEGRANEFMGALLAPPLAVHTRLLALCREEGLRMVRGAHVGRPGGPIVSRDNYPEAVGGVTAVLADEFGVSERFMAVRLDRYGLVQGGRT